jgi:hypothetical protein
MKTSMEDPLGGDDGGPTVLTTYLEDVDSGPLGDNDRETGATTTNLEDVDGRLPRRR